MHAPTNVGSPFRIADGLGLRKCLAGESITPPNSNLRKTSGSTQQQVDYTSCEEALAVAQKLRGKGYRLICLEITPDSNAT